MKKRGKFYYAVLGAVTGIANGLFGSGGGIIAVPMLQKADIEVKKSHATSLALTLPLSVVSVIFYAIKSTFNFRDAIFLIPFGLAGAVIGSLLLKKISNVWLKRIFGAFLIAAGWRMIFK
ncbi:MAG: sulfite exporter TauE/SafE family protein [Oscillospiraceae bacterium]|nr:sulfite exporter TauE/SafE family protein [Oscillospiraceae bacterium]